MSSGRTLWLMRLTAFAVDVVDVVDLRVDHDTRVPEFPVEVAVVGPGRVGIGLVLVVNGLAPADRGLDGEHRAGRRTGNRARGQRSAALHAESPLLPEIVVLGAQVV